MLTIPQAEDLLAKIRSMKQNSGINGGNSNQVVKLQTVKTNSITGTKQAVITPVSSLDLVNAINDAKKNGSPIVTLTAAISPPKQQAGIRVVKGLSKTTSSGHVAEVSRASADAYPSVRVVKIANRTAPSSSLLHSIAVVNKQISIEVPATSSSTMSNSVYRTNSVLPASKRFQPQSPSTESRLKNGLLSSFQQPIFADAASSSHKKSDINFDRIEFSDSKRRKTDKSGKGLRHFSMKVCEKVQAKGLTSYNEVADELVSELTDPSCVTATEQQYDQKNIRRRVYDALNVLMAMNIISKEKKEIRWLGLPTNSATEAKSLERDKNDRIERIKIKNQHLQDLILQQITFKNLVERNREREKERGGPPAPNSAIQLPFIVVNTSRQTVIDCSISNDKMEYLFNFDNTFEIHDDMEIMKRMGLGFGLEKGQISNADLVKARLMVPRSLDQYVTQLAVNGPGFIPSVMDISPLVTVPDSKDGLNSIVKIYEESDHDEDSDVEV